MAFLKETVTLWIIAPNFIELNFTEVFLYALVSMASKPK